jgi:hypothetical protein
LENTMKEKPGKGHTTQVPLTREIPGKANIPNRGGTFNNINGGGGGIVTNTLPAPTKPGSSGGSNKQGK